MTIENIKELGPKYRLDSLLCANGEVLQYTQILRRNSGIPAPVVKCIGRVAKRRLSGCNRKKIGIEIIITWIADVGQIQMMAKMIMEAISCLAWAKVNPLAGAIGYVEKVR